MAGRSNDDRRQEVVGRFALEQETFGGSGMLESERPRMQHRPPCIDLRAGVVANVHPFADQRMAELGQVDSNLMLASGFKAAFDQALRLTSPAIGLMCVTERFASIGASCFVSPEMSMRSAHPVATIDQKDTSRHVSQ